MQWQFNNICPCAESEGLPRLVRRKVTMLHVFTVCFQKVYKSSLLFLVTLPGSTDTLLHNCQFEGSCYYCLTWRQWYLILKNVLSIPSLNWTLALHLFVQSGEALQWKEINTHTHTHARARAHTHTHAHTHNQGVSKNCNWFNIQLSHNRTATVLIALGPTQL